MAESTDFLETQKRYDTKVLVGNWFEERLVYDRENKNHVSSYSVDYKQRGFQQPDVTLRRTGWLRSNGVGKEVLLAHHGDAYMKNWITWYDEDYNKRGMPRKPPLREWHSGNMAWCPERSDFPVQGTPTNWGLKQKQGSAWNPELRQRSSPSKNDFSTTYKTSYLQPSTSDLLASRRPNMLPPISASAGVSQDKFEEPGQRLSVVAS